MPTAACVGRNAWSGTRTGSDERDDPLQPRLGGREKVELEVVVRGLVIVFLVFLEVLFAMR
jgi:hypothetical protein